jgi:hypothetical protein
MESPSHLIRGKVGMGVTTPSLSPLGKGEIAFPPSTSSIACDKLEMLKLDDERRPLWLNPR